VAKRIRVILFRLNGFSLIPAALLCMIVNAALAQVRKAQGTI